MKLPNRSNPVFDLAMAVCVSGTAIITGCVTNPETMLHWFVVPVFISGVLIGVDFFAWLRNRISLFDPVGLVGAYGYYFFFVAPLLTVLWRYHTPELQEPPNWRDWVGLMAVINCLGLIVYLFIRRFLENRNARPSSILLFRQDSLVHVMAVALPLTLVVQVLIYVSFGGIWGFMEAFSDNYKAFSGMGWIFMFGEAFPSLLALFVLVYKRKQIQRTSWAAISLLIAAFFVAKLFFGGLHGSRSATVWGVFWLVGSIHLWIKPVPRRLVGVGILFLVAFMYLYGFYKQQGTAALETIQSEDEMEVSSQKSGRTIDTALLSDLGRSEIQAYVLYRLSAVRDYDYAGGSTYISALTVLIPKSIRPDWFPSKLEKGTEALHGKGTYSPEYRQASQVYGLAGEAMLNFTPICVPFVFMALAYAVVKIRAMLSLHSDDARRLSLPFLLNGCIVVLNSDLDNIIVFFVTTALPVYLILKFCTRKTSFEPLRSSSPAGRISGSPETPGLPHWSPAPGR